MEFRNSGVYLVYKDRSGILWEVANIRESSHNLFLGGVGVELEGKRYLVNYGECLGSLESDCKEELFMRAWDQKLFPVRIISRDVRELNCFMENNSGTGHINEDENGLHYVADLIAFEL